MWWPWLSFGEACCMTCGISVPQPGTKPAAPAVEEQSLNHRTTRQVPTLSNLTYGLASYCRHHDQGFKSCLSKEHRVTKDGEPPHYLLSLPVHWFCFKVSTLNYPEEFKESLYLQTVPLDLLGTLRLKLSGRRNSFSEKSWVSNSGLIYPGTFEFPGRVQVQMLSLLGNGWERIYHGILHVCQVLVERKRSQLREASNYLKSLTSGLVRIEPYLNVAFLLLLRFRGYKGTLKTQKSLTPVKSAKLFQN